MCVIVDDVKVDRKIAQGVCDYCDNNINIIIINNNITLNKTNDTRQCLK